MVDHVLYVGVWTGKSPARSAVLRSVRTDIIKTGPGRHFRPFLPHCGRISATPPTPRAMTAADNLPQSRLRRLAVGEEGRALRQQLFSAAAALLIATLVLMGTSL